MSLFHSMLLFAQSDAPEAPEFSWISGPTFFFTLMGACLVMIVVGAVVDRLPEAEDEEDTDADDEMEATVSEKDKRKAKLEAKAAKKLAKAEKKKAKAAKKKGKKGKGKQALAAAVEPAEAEEAADLFADRADESVDSFAEDGEATVEESLEFEDETALDDLEGLVGELGDDDFGTDDDFQFDVEPKE